MKTGMFIVALGLSGLLACSVADTRPQNYQECVDAGNVILRSLPPQCVTRDGHRFKKEEPAQTGKQKICKDLCGDGQCQQIVCMAEGCPCPENRSLCPADCS